MKTLLSVVWAVLSIALPESSALAQCGGEGQRPCTVLERIPSCDKGLVEDFSLNKCVKPKPAAKPKLNCGAENQRPCTVTERIPSCDPGLVEDLILKKCIKPVSKADLERAAQNILAPDKLPQFTKAAEAATQEVHWIVEAVKNHMGMLKDKGVSYERLAQLAQSGQRNELYRVFEISTLSNEIKVGIAEQSNNSIRHDQAGLLKPMSAALGNSAAPIQDDKIKYMSFSFGMQGGLIVGGEYQQGGFISLREPLSGGADYVQLGWSVGASAIVGVPLVLGFWEEIPEYRVTMYGDGFTIGGAYLLGAQGSFWWGNSASPHHGKFLGFTVGLQFPAIGVEVEYGRMMIMRGN